MYGIWCTTTGGVTGDRAAWLKNKEGNIAVFYTEEEAKEKARKLNENKSPLGPAIINYSPRLLTE